MGSRFTTRRDLAGALANHYEVYFWNYDEALANYAVTPARSVDGAAVIICEVSQRAGLDGVSVLVLRANGREFVNHDGEGWTVAEAVWLVNDAWGAGGWEGVIFEYSVSVTVVVRGGRVEWSSVDDYGSLVSVHNAETGNECMGLDHDELVDALGSLADERVVYLLGGER
jgi:hypothetical protein